MYTGVSEHLPGLQSQGPHSILGFISRNRLVLTRERKEKKGKEKKSPESLASSPELLQNKSLWCGEKTSQIIFRVGKPFPTLAPGRLVSPKEGKGRKKY